ncbi:MAG: hypothetical protein IPJ26_17890 [Bacteroidetes bacterium]|jgi:uncharacterized membrane protein|nr:hypothetical protein [Bacteroidota bacterium]
MKTIKLLKLSLAIGLLVSLSPSISMAQESTKANEPTQVENTSKTVDISKDFTGLSVSPSTLHFNLSPGKSKSMEVKIKNDTKKKYIFQANFSDFVMGVNGKPIGQANGSQKFGLSSWASMTPSYFELEPGTTQKVVVTVNVPDGAESNHAAWTVLMLDEVNKRAPLNVNGTANTVALGITPSVGFGVYIYQNPTDHQLEKIEIENFVFNDSTQHRQLKLSASNLGEGIGFCTSYVEITNLESGEQYKLKAQKFTILPGFGRVFYYDLSNEMKPGKYSAVGVIDTNNPDQVTAAEIEFNIN